MRPSPSPGAPFWRSREGHILIIGRFDLLRLSCVSDLDPEARLRGRNLELRVTPAHFGFACVRRWQHLGYEARIHDVPPGPLQLRIIHIVPDMGSQVVLETELEL